jgi:hypothetical protein
VVRMQAKAGFSLTPRGVLSRSVLCALAEGSPAGRSAQDRVVPRREYVSGVVALVAFPLRSVASAFLPSPRDALAGAFAHSRRAAHVDNVSRISLRLADKLKGRSAVSMTMLSSQLRSRAYTLPDVWAAEGPATSSKRAFQCVPSGVSRH